MKKIVHVFISFVMLAMLMTACSPAPKAPAATETIAPQPSATLEPSATPKPTAAPLPQGDLITPQNAAQLVKIGEIPSGMIFSLRWSLDGSVFWVVTESGATLYNSRTLETIAAYIPAAGTQVLDASADGKTLALTSDMRSIALFDARANQATVSFTPTASFGSVEFSPDGRKLLTTSQEAWEVTLWDTTSGQVLDVLTGFETAAPIYSAHFTSDGNGILWIARGTLQPMDIPSKLLAQAIQHEDFIVDSVVMPDRRYILSAAAGTVKGVFTPLVKVSAWQATSTKLLTQIVVTNPISALAINPSVALVAVANADKISFWQEEKELPVAEVPSGAPSVTALAFSPDGHLLLAGIENGVQLWAVNPR